ncbi:MAG: porphobilinogen synthase [Polaribacter sp.]|jgi:porphobilinogen synthase
MGLDCARPDSLKIMFRTRRLRKTDGIRRLVRETKLSVDDFIYPLFIEEGENIETEIVSMPGIKRFSLDRISKELDEVVELNIPAVLLFGIPSTKDEEGTETWNDNGIMQQAIRFIKKNYPDLYVITDVCFCEYTSHGHCGVIHDNDVDNDATLVNLAKQVISHAKAGVDMVAPSGMMDGTIAMVRESLDNTGFVNLPIMAYSVKYASAFYGPFRDAADSAPTFGDRRTYQMDPANRDEGMREATFDDQEGADILMVKPALSYLDIIRDLKNNFDRPIACYNVSGEYAMVKAAAEKGWIDGEKVMMESLLSMKRAGADIIITYFAKEAARVLLK